MFKFKIVGGMLDLGFLMRCQYFECSLENRFCFGNLEGSDNSDYWFTNKKRMTRGFDV